MENDEDELVGMYAHPRRADAVVYWEEDGEWWCVNYAHWVDKQDATPYKNTIAGKQPANPSMFTRQRLALAKLAHIQVFPSIRAYKWGSFDGGFIVLYPMDEPEGDV